MAKATIRVKVEGAVADPVQYKPWTPTYTFDELYVEVPVETSKGDDVTPGETVLTPDTFANLLTQLGIITAKANDTYQEERMK